ncbi:hypothetical protein LEMLEM_LOCUS318 [Lemmus lemmus]
MGVIHHCGADKWMEHCRALSSGHDVTIALLNSRQL